MSYLACILIGVVIGLVINEKLFPQVVNNNDVTQNFKKANVNGSPEVKIVPQETKPKRVLGFLWRKKTKQ